MSVVGFIGVGELALYTIKGLRRGGYDGRILLSPRNPDKALQLQQECACEVQPDNQGVVAQSDFVILATRPADCLDALAELRFTPGQVLISVVAGVEINRLRSALSGEIEIVRAMPVSSAEVCSSPTLIFPQHDFVCSLFDHCGAAIAVDREGCFDQGTILACVYSWYFALFENLIAATQGPNLPADVAAQLVMGMARGAAELALKKSDRSPGSIADAIATDGTYSRLGLDLLLREEAFSSWHDACELLKRQLAED